MGGLPEWPDCLADWLAACLLMLPARSRAVLRKLKGVQYRPMGTVSSERGIVCASCSHEKKKDRSVRKATVTHYSPVTVQTRRAVCAQTRAWCHVCVHACTAALDLKCCVLPQYPLTALLPFDKWTTSVLPAALPR